MSTLIVCFSRSGHTRQVALHLSKRLSATCEELIDRQSYKGLTGFLRGGYSAYRKKTGRIMPLRHNPVVFERVIICTPVWASGLPPAIRTFAQQYATKLTQTAYVALCGDSNNGKKALAQLTEIAGKPQASMIITDKELKSPDHYKKIEAFADKLSS